MHGDVRMRPIKRLRNPIARLAFVLIAANACGGPDEASERSAARSAAGDTATRSDTAAVAFEAGDDFPLPFRTTVPRGLTAEIEQPSHAEGMAGAVRFANPAERETAFLRLVVLDEELDANDANGLVRSIATDFGVIGSQGLEYEEASAAPSHPWAATSYRLRGVMDGRPVDGWVSLGEHDGHYFYVMAIAPNEAATRLAPAWDHVLHAWTWTGGDQPVPLVRGAGPDLR